MKAWALDTLFCKDREDHQIPLIHKGCERSTHSTCGIGNGKKDDLDGLATVLVTQLH